MLGMASAPPLLVARRGNVELEVHSYLIAEALVAHVFAGEAEDTGSSEARRTAEQARSSSGTCMQPILEVDVDEQDDEMAQHVESGVVVLDLARDDEWCGGSGVAAARQVAAGADLAEGEGRGGEGNSCEQVGLVARVQALPAVHVFPKLEDTDSTKRQVSEEFTARGDKGGSSVGEQLLHDIAGVSKGFTEGGLESKLEAEIASELAKTARAEGQPVPPQQEAVVSSEMFLAKVGDGLSVGEQLLDGVAVVGKGFTESEEELSL
ncbi:unnamed protein product [Prorocentrum cordatum]|uniref:Uncharacterized protein n=1 Tax=Prorocentrum cordatum TaxID=2364126 RepID=A0ABN9SHL2_9DINO|nr:unnamed protein product [Polarella glacialis]